MPDDKPTTAAATEPAPRVLLVDDSATNLRILSETLEGRGYELLVAQGGRDAIAVAAAAHPALILLDVMMPGLDGFEVCRRLKAEEATRDAAVIFLSALGDTADKVKGLDLGAVDYITKPFQAEEVIARVDTHLTIWRLQRDLLERNRQLAALNERMKRNLDAAAEVQQGLLPAQLPGTPHANFAWAYRPCDELAGDALNIFALDADHVGLFVLDVSGHGVPGALLSVALTHALTPRLDPSCLVTRPQGGGDFIVAPAEVLGRLNRLFPMRLDVGQFVTILYGILDLRQTHFRYASAGHPAPVLDRPGRPPDVLQCSGLPIGVAADASYEEHLIPLERRDRLYLYTDGLVEAQSPAGEMLGKPRALELITAGRSMPLPQSVEHLQEQVVAWAGGPGLRDDLSIVGVEVV